MRPTTDKLPAERPGVALVTLGCPKNEVSSRALREGLSASGYSVVDPEAADAIIVNTCGFIEAAREESVDTILELLSGYQAVPTIAFGCLADGWGDELSKALPELAGVYRSERVKETINAVGEALGRSPVDQRKQAQLGLTPPECGPSAYLQISEGCDRACRFCLIPGFKGEYVSRRLEELVAEATVLSRSGAKELVLVAQETGSYGSDLTGSVGLAQLVSELSRVDAIEWLRIMYLQPDSITGELLEVVESEPSVCSYLDVPFQHASSSVLERMGRGGDADEFLEIISVLRRADPMFALRTSLIVGYPGETEDDFDHLCRFVEAADLDYVGVFTFSPEIGTGAAGLADQVSPEIARDRMEKLRALADRVGEARAAARVGSSVEVLVERRTPTGWLGRGRFQAPEVDGEILFSGPAGSGQLVTVELTGADGYDLLGRSSESA